MDICSPQLIWVDGRCYRSNLETNHSVTTGYTGEHESMFGVDDEVADDVADSFQHVIEETSGGRYMSCLQVASAFFPQIIGKGGQTKNRLEKDTDTKILIPRKGVEGDIRITGSDKRGVVTAANRIDVMVAAARNKISFTHFISLPLNSTELQKSFCEFREDVLDKCGGVRGLDPTIFQTPSLLHLTIGTMALLDERERDLARTILQDCKEEVVIPLLGESGITITLGGLEYMNDDPAEVDVLYAKIVDKDGKLQTMADKIVTKFVESGLMSRQYDRVKLHATLINTLFRKESGDVGDKNDQGESRESFDARPVLEKWSNIELGLAVIQEVHLSQRRAGKRTKEGYYLPSCIVSLTSCG